MTYYIWSLEKITFYIILNKKKEHDDIIPTIALVKDDWHKREDGAAKTSVVLLKQRSNTYLPVCQEGLLNGGRRVEAAGPA